MGLLFPERKRTNRMDEPTVDTGLLIGAFEDHSYEARYVLDRTTGEVIFVYPDSLSEEEEEQLEERFDSDPGRYITVEPMASSEAFEIMEDFVESLSTSPARRQLERALNGRRPFRRFKDALYDLPSLREAWHHFHGRRMVEYASEWLRSEGVELPLRSVPWLDSPDAAETAALEPARKQHLLATIAAAAELARAGALPFASRLVDADEAVVVDAVNEVQRTGDPTAHAEIALLRRAAKDLAPEVLRRATVYTAIEPCAMCASALILAGVERVVYAIGSDAVALHLELPEDVVVPGVTGTAVFDSTEEGPEVIGPVLESEALARIFKA